MSRQSTVDEQEVIILEENSSLVSTNDDLKELCLLLDEERYKMHQLAEQWKHFGTSTINKLASQIVDYEEKLHDLEERQTSLLKENESLKSLIDQFMLATINNTSTQLVDKQSERNVSTQTPIDRQESSPDMSMNDSLQRQISLQNMFDAIKTAEIYESIGNITGDDESGKTILKEFCNLIWKYLEERSKPKSSCLL
ncbi:unnamed protein product [Rotaria magnacalcarata]|uniref:Uncharacterized protein n=2 Tax=Rotaria magnacalcarata TaxID=392030 RepID=A0A816PZ63_9BILA|nr:unnamed protein product [Rotaria magnacalcarata]CAF2054919.1 unnamed protein product [Rotaria magnacalcarata]CAF2066361.1 unnamed protein product [Rotaria magnacalcarata]CAF2128333.1 unnamed protein product [Rotaria magnacalcarata]